MRALWQLFANATVLSRAFGRRDQQDPDLHGTIIGLDALQRRWPSLVGDHESSPIFILAAGWRSGSTLLQRMVLANGRTMVWGEPYAHGSIGKRLALQMEAFSGSWPEDVWFATDHTKQLAGAWTANLYPPVESLVNAHAAFWRNLLGDPARHRGYVNWGLKETRWGMLEARYLRWLFPRSRIVFMYRCPFDAYASYRNWGDWYWEWPHKRITSPKQFGKMWRQLTNEFVTGYSSVGGYLVRYDDLLSARHREELGGYLDEEICSPEDIPWRSGHTGPQGKLNVLELARLEAAVYPLAEKLGFLPPRTSGRSLMRWTSRSASSSPSSAART